MVQTAMSTARHRSRTTTAFVFAGGGSFGSVQVGMLKALCERGIIPDLVIGSSVGAMNAAFFASNPTAGGVSELESIWRGLRRSDVFPATWRILLGLTGRTDGLWTADSLRNIILKHIPFRDLAHASIPLHVVATDLQSGKSVVLSRGNVEDAVLASSAIPGAFAPIEIGGRLLADGAISSNTPVLAAAERGATRIVVLPTGSLSGLQSPPRGAHAVAMHAVTLLLAQQTSAEVRSLGCDVECHVVPPPRRLSGSPCDFSRTDELIALSARTASAWLDTGVLAEKILRWRRIDEFAQAAA